MLQHTGPCKILIYFQLGDSFQCYSIYVSKIKHKINDFFYFLFMFFSIVVLVMESVINFPHKYRIEYFRAVEHGIPMESFAIDNNFFNSMF